MSYINYKIGAQIAIQGYPFYALIQAALRQADTDNLQKLKEAWPQEWEDLDLRYHAAGGALPGEDAEALAEALGDLPF